MLAVTLFVLINMLFLGIGWGLTTYLAWVAKIQFLPSLLALDYTMLAVLLLVTFVFGRIYCSVICPLGVMQDIFAWMGKKAKKNRYSHSAELKGLRYSVLAIFLICLAIGFTPVVTLLAPYSDYGRIVTTIFRPLFDGMNNGLAALETTYTGTFLFAERALWMRSLLTLIVAVVSLVVLAILAWRNGRTYCNSICPVGTMLSFVSRFSLLRMQINKTRCKNCSLCERNCKTAAIDFRSGKIDYSRCVVCGNCADVCRHDALHYAPAYRLKKAADADVPFVPKNEKKDATPKNIGVDKDRRAFLTGVALAAGATAMAQTKIKVDGGLAVIEDKKAPERKTVVTPPGSVSAFHLARHCTACQLCVSACPNDVLRPGTDPLRFMQPVMSFERGYCRPECTRCGEVCPTDAILPFSAEEKTAIHAGHAVWIRENCIPVVNGDECGNCARHCPSWAIHMEETEVVAANGDRRMVNVPVVDVERCLGCGACENLCPARPFSAIYVEGNEMHHID